MCRAVRCNTCGKTTWAGCGAHVEQVMRQVKPDERCGCRTRDVPRDVQGIDSASPTPRRMWNAVRSVFRR